MKRKCTELLTAEHKIILRAAFVLNAMAKSTTDQRPPSKEDVDGIIEILRVFADDFHQGKEESALFPVFTAKCSPAEIAAVRHMVFEHEQDRSLIEGIQDSVKRSDRTDFGQYATKLSDTLQNHIYKEDHFLFEMVNQMLSEEDDNKVCAEFESFDRAFYDQGHDRVLHRLSMLEWKYLGKAA